MPTQAEILRFRKRLSERRRELLEHRNSLKHTWIVLQQREVEPEETAQKLSISQGLEQLDRQEKEEIEAIDEALNKMNLGNYGRCESCGKMISKKRLGAIPWAPLCTKCAIRQEENPERPLRSPVSPRGAEHPKQYEGIADTELREAISDELEKDGSVETDRLDISCREGVVYIKGALPGHRSHEILMEILQENMGLTDVVDDIKIDQTAEEQRGQVPKTEEEVLLEGEDTKKAVYESQKDGIPVSPPDRFVPEKDK